MESAVTSNASYVDEQYARWQRDPAEVSAEWRAFFEGFALGRGGPAEPAVESTGESQSLQAHADALIHRHRDLGHRIACLDPLSPCPDAYPLLEPASVGLTAADLDRDVLTDGVLTQERAALRRVLEALRDIYCGSLGIEYLHVQDPGEREWIRARLEPAGRRPGLTADEKRRALDLLTRAGRFEEFLQRRYPGQTRFSLEGAEGTLVLLGEVLRSAAAAGAQEVVLAMAHRGRLSTQVNLLGKSLEEAFCEFEASYDPEAAPGRGDVKYHSGYLAEIEVGDEHRLQVLMPENPSHLEAVNPVAEGIARARQERRGPDGTGRVLPLLVHGDAALSGQGVVAETLNLSGLEGYSTGGTIHVVLNNQIGFTTPPERARSTRYATDVAKMVLAPILHVHGEDPEALVRAGRLAVAYRNRFAKDVVVDVVGYRRHGHNEGDEPYFTQPLLYRRIRARPPVHELYLQRLLGDGTVEAGAAETARQEVDRRLETAHDAARSQACAWRLTPTWHGWEGIPSLYSHEVAETGVGRVRLGDLVAQLCSPPEGFSLHPTLQRVLDRRREAAAASPGAVDWATAETLAFATLLAEGVPVRLSGEDSARGTFSQRHAAWFDAETGARYVPLTQVSPGQGVFEVLDSALSEVGVLGFEYGYSAARPDALVLWEAQYGDFVTGAQVIVDEFLASGEAKWRRRSGLVLLLPHGYEGQGPDHSTGRPERFLELCAQDNLQVCAPSTPAQYFHLLRRQMKRPFRKPLIAFTPKSLLRHPDVVSPLDDLAGGGFREVLADPEPAPTGATRRVVLCTGKLAVELEARRREKGVGGVALVRLEQLYPFPDDPLRAVLASYRGAEEWCWAQEEPRNMGAWRFLAPRLAEIAGGPVHCIGRPEAASPATGFPFIHRQEQEAVLAEALE